MVGQDTVVGLAISNRFAELDEASDAERRRKKKSLRLRQDWRLGTK